MRFDLETLSSGRNEMRRKIFCDEFFFLLEGEFSREHPGGRGLFQALFTLFT